MSRSVKMLASLAVLSLMLVVPAFAAAPHDITGTWGTGGGLTPIVLPDGSICMFGCAKIAAQAGLSKAPSVPAAVQPPRVPDRPIYKAEYQAKVADLDKNQVRKDPALRCGNPGLPRIGPPDKIVQTGDQVIFLYDDMSGSFWRVVQMNAPHRKDVDPSFLGDAVGHWEGDKLVVETTGFNDISWLVDNGAFHTDKLKITEKFQRVESDKLLYEVTVEDPVLAQPWIIKPRLLKKDAVEVQEPAGCAEEDVDKIKDLTEHHDNQR